MMINTAGTTGHNPAALAANPEARTLATQPTPTADLGLPVLGSPSSEALRRATALWRVDRLPTSALSSLPSATPPRAVELEAPGLVVEFETLPPMTENPAWGIELTRVLPDGMA